MKSLQTCGEISVEKAPGVNTSKSEVSFYLTAVPAAFTQQLPECNTLETLQGNLLQPLSLADHDTAAGLAAAGAEALTWRRCLPLNLPFGIRQRRHQRRQVGELGSAGRPPPSLFLVCAAAARSQGRPAGCHFFQEAHSPEHLFLQVLGRCGAFVGLQFVGSNDVSPSLCNQQSDVTSSSTSK